ncbi:MAG: acetyl-CoA carboxylase biotin carboxyl carrier protein subunit [Bacteroidaceae bacterium]|nr:acetyl-CoA carboxylase biotin carboxyl carrier protein subunit [Bacteroidaceae bacterium]
MKEYKYKVNGVEYKVNINAVEGNIAKVEVNGVAYEVQMEGRTAAPKPVAAPRPAASVAAAPAASKPAAPAPAAAPTGAGKALKAPLPGVINDIKVAVGTPVKAGQTVLILEAMKMENEINAECDGTVTSIAVNKGDSVMEGAVLLTIG